MRWQPAWRQRRGALVTSGWAADWLAAEAVELLEPACVILASDDWLWPGAWCVACPGVS